MKEVSLTITKNIPLNLDTYKMVLRGDTAGLKAGQFLELTVPGFFLRRPFGIADSTDNSLTILYKNVGQGTAAMTTLKEGQVLSALIGLGNGFNLKKSKKPLVIGGGIGIAPLYKLCKEFNAMGIKPQIVLGFRGSDDAFYIDEFAKLGNVTVSTDDGCIGFFGNAVECVDFHLPDYDYYFACGPLVMLKNLAARDTQGEISLEARMGCGFGACMGCSIQTTKGARRVCKEGPIFSAGEVIFND